MEEVTGTVGGFRAAIQDLLVPELKALQVEVRNLKETLERHEQKISQLVEGLHQLSKDQAERFAAIQQEMDKRFAETQKENNDKFNAVLEAIRKLQQDVSTIMMQMSYTEKFHQLEMQIARLAKTGNPVAL